MRVAYVGNFLPEHSTENDVRKAFEYLGHEVIQFQENESTRITTLINYDYDLLLITGTWDCTPDELAFYITVFKECAGRGIPTATLHVDTFWDKSRGGRQWWLHPMFHTAYIFSADGDHQDKWKAFGKNHIWLPPAVRHNAVHMGKFRKEYACDVAFVGSNGVGYHEAEWPYRKELLFHLKMICKKNGWSFKNPGGDDPKISRGEDMNDFYASAKVTVGDSLCLKKERSKYWSDRVPEATGRGGFLIMPRIHNLNKMYENSIPMYSWGEYKGLESLIGAYLEDEPFRKKLTREAHNITAEKHTYVNRVQTIIKKLGLE